MVVAGVVRHRGDPAPGAVLTAIDTGGRQIGRAEADDRGAYALHRAAPGRAHLLVVRWHDVPHAELLPGDAVGALAHDVDLAPVPRTRVPQEATP